MRETKSQGKKSNRLRNLFSHVDKNFGNLSTQEDIGQPEFVPLKDQF